MSIQFFANPFPQGVVTGAAADERDRCVLILEGLPLGYRNGEEHEVLEDFVRRAVILIRLGVEVKESID